MSCAFDKSTLTSLKIGLKNVDILVCDVYTCHIIIIILSHSIEKRPAGLSIFSST